MAHSSPRIVVAGSANMDLVGLAARLPLPGETVLGDDFVMTPGGKGANQAIAAVRAGGSCTMLGAIGSDAFGVTIKARLNASGVDTRNVRTSYGPSGVAVGPRLNSGSGFPGRFLVAGPDPGYRAANDALAFR